MFGCIALTVINQPTSVLAVDEWGLVTTSARFYLIAKTLQESHEGDMKPSVKLKYAISKIGLTMILVVSDALVMPTREGAN